MKDKELVFETLKLILVFYDNMRFCCKQSEQEAVDKTLKAYNDFYEWLNEK